jgi:hypothetical protein
LETVLLISVGAIIGGNLRYFVAQYVARLIPSSFPLGALIIKLAQGAIPDVYRRFFLDCLIFVFFTAVEMNHGSRHRAHPARRPRA